MLSNTSSLCQRIRLQKLGCLRNWVALLEKQLRPSAQAAFHSSGSQNVGLKVNNEVDDSYALLSLSEGCDYGQLKEAYIRLAKLYHPDSGLETADASKFTRVQHAYRVVKENLKSGESQEVEIEEPEIVFDIKHTAPQHRQYLTFDGIGFGTPNQRQRQYQQHRVAKATETISDIRVQKIAVEYEDALVVRDKQAMKKHKTQNYMDRLVEDLIKDAMEKGDFQDLPGTGKPLPGHSEINPFVDSTTHNLNKILINDGFAPAWIALERDIRQEIRRSREVLAKERNYIQTAERGVSDHVTRHWSHHCNNFRQSVEDVNEKIRKYNMVVPFIQKQMVEYNAEKEIKKIYDNWTMYLPPDFDEDAPRFVSYQQETQQKIVWDGVWTHIKEMFASRQN